MAPEHEISEDGQQPQPAGATPPMPGFVYYNTVNEWEAWSDPTQVYWCYYNTVTKNTQWHNPLVPENNSSTTKQPAVDKYPISVPEDPSIPPYNPKIHGDYDNWRIMYKVSSRTRKEVTPEDEKADLEKKKKELFAAQANFNRMTGTFQNPALDPSNHSDEAKAKRQMEGFFDHDAWAAKHEGRSLKDERRKQKVSKAQIKEWKDGKAAKKREKFMKWINS
jgi:hypothetical protein